MVFCFVGKRVWWGVSKGRNLVLIFFFEEGRDELGGGRFGKDLILFLLG